MHTKSLTHNYRYMLAYHLNVKVEKKLLMKYLKEMHFPVILVDAVNVVALSESIST